MLARYRFIDSAGLERQLASHEELLAALRSGELHGRSPFYDAGLGRWTLAAENPAFKNASALVQDRTPSHATISATGRVLGDWRAPAKAADWRHDLRHASGEGIVLLAGIASTIAVVAVDGIFKSTSGVDVPSLSLFLIIPVGAVLAGMLAGLGYYWAAQWRHEMPSKSLAFNMALVGLSAWAAIQWTDYATARLPNGRPVARIASFGTYFRAKTERASYRFHRSRASTGAVGKFGYVIAGTQVIGFVVGSFAMFGLLLDKRTCSSCRKYVRSERLLSEVNGVALAIFLSERGLDLPNSSAKVRAALADRPFRAFSLDLDECPFCGKTWVSLLVGHSQHDYAFAGTWVCPPEMKSDLKRVG